VSDPRRDVGAATGASVAPSVNKWVNETIKPLTDPLLLPSAQRFCSGRGGGFMQAKGDRMSVPVSDDSTGRRISCVS
jgi:hypothetical protein